MKTTRINNTRWIDAFTNRWISLGNIILCAGFLLLTVQGNTQFYNNPLMTARNLAKGTSEIGAGYQYYRYSGDNFSGKVSENLVARVGFGLSDRTDIYLRYERIEPSDGINYVSLTPKFSFANNEWAVIIPVGIVFSDHNSTGIFSPGLLYTKRKGAGFESTFMVGTNIFTEDPDFLLDFTLGFGLSNDLDRWAVRPEAGIHVNPGEDGYIWNVGVAITANLSAKSKQ